MLPLLLLSLAPFLVPAAETDWGPLSFLIGEWAGDGGGQPGKGAGEFSFREDLQGKVLVRRSFAEYPAAQGRPAYRHDDLMIVYREAGATRAVFFDNEGHVIHYAVTAAGDSVQFLSEPAAAARFRFTYRKTGPAAVSMKFEIATPGKPDAFSIYLEATARRR